jgi:hypothetical protein
MKKEISLVILLILPILTVYYMLKWTSDAISTILAVNLLCYSFACWLYDKVIADFKWSWFVGKETKNFCSKMLDGVGFTLLFVVLSAAFLILMSMYSSWGLGHKMVLPFPILKGSWDTCYHIAFFLIFTIALPLGEEAFYRVFQANQWKGILADVMISVFYAGMNLAIVYSVFDSWTPKWIFTFFSFVIAMILVAIRDKSNVVNALMSRIGLALGVYLWIFFLERSVKSAIPRLQPTYVFIADVNNWFSK